MIQINLEDVLGAFSAVIILLISYAISKVFEKIDAINTDISIIETGVEEIKSKLTQSP